jgi:hypothetical protein
MKTLSTRSGLLEPLYTFECPRSGYSILIVPHSEEVKSELISKAKGKRMSLRDYARTEILGTVVLGRMD